MYACMRPEPDDKALGIAGSLWSARSGLGMISRSIKRSAWHGGGCDEYHIRVFYSSGAVYAVK